MCAAAIKLSRWGVTNSRDLKKNHLMKMMFDVSNVCSSYQGGVSQTPEISGKLFDVD